MTDWIVKLPQSCQALVTIITSVALLTLITLHLHLYLHPLLIRLPVWLRLAIYKHATQIRQRSTYDICITIPIEVRCSYSPIGVHALLSYIALYGAPSWHRFQTASLAVTLMPLNVLKVCRPRITVIAISHIAIESQDEFFQEKSVHLGVY